MSPCGPIAIPIRSGIACLVTPVYIDRPWFYAEWATFWYQRKPWYLLTLDTNLDDIFDVMKRRQTCFLNDRHSVQRLIEHFAEDRLLKGQTCWPPKS